MGSAACCPVRSVNRFTTDSIYAAALDCAVAAMGLTVLKTPVRGPQANAFCERLIGTIRRECLDWLILVNEQHLRFVLRDWVAHYNQVDHTPVSVPAFPTGRSARWRGHTGIESLMATESSPPRSWRGYITNIG